MIDLHFSLSDRIRYYWPHSRISQAVNTMLSNLQQSEIPLGLLSQYMPVQFGRILSGKLNTVAPELIIDKIQDVLRAYRYGCTVAPEKTEVGPHA